MLLDDRKPVDLVVIGQNVVVAGHQAEGFGALQFPQGLEAEVHVEEKIRIRPGGIGIDHQRLNDADFADRGED